MASLNKVFVLGNIGNDLILRQTAGAVSVTNMSIATNRSFADAKGHVQTSVEWHKIVIWGKLAETCAKFLKKGDAAMVDGRLQTSKYNKNGADTYATEIIAENVQFLNRAKFTPGTEEREQDASGEVEAAIQNDLDIP